MDAFSSSSSRPSWSKALYKKPREPTVTLPLLARRSSGQLTRKDSLHSYLLEANGRENYSRSQLRAMASSKLQPSSNNARIHSNTERLTPLDPASFNKTRKPQRRALPEPIQATINGVLATEALSERGESRDDSPHEPETPIPEVKRTSPCKAQLQSRRPEWNRYIRRIMMTNGIRGSTLARYRRLVGIVARKNLTQSYAGAAERVVRYRLEFQSAAMIQALAVGFLNRKRRAKLLQRTRAATRIQYVWRRVLELKKQQKKAEAIRIETLDTLLRLGATRSIQRSYRKHRHACYLREEERRQQEHAGMLQKARLKLLQRYQTWRESSKRSKNDQFSAVGKILESNYQVDADKIPDCKVATTCASTVRNEIADAETSRVEAHEVILDRTEQSSVPINTLPCQTDQRSIDEEATEENSLPQYQSTEANQDEPESSSLQNDRDGDVSTSLLFPKVDQLEVAITVNTEPDDDNKSEQNNEDTGKIETPEVSSDPHSFESDLDQVDDVEMEELGTVAATTTETTAIARATATKRIAYFLLPKLQSRLAQKTHVAIQIQCLVRSYLAKKCMARVRLAALHSLRAQLLATWLPVREFDSKERQSDDSTPNNEEDDFDSELQRNQSSLHTGSDDYTHVLPTRNGQIPPGVPLLQSSAGVPLLSLWKWNWPSERWISNQ
ncbi:hypothetical protein V7S43_007398 [Phytophthora oleae]|uniref:DUF4005 domain-containing protein n=1 Tax=Phytophthora oleae TaxID=2107226 RepID=A0ABD3FLU7_9STRA